jgi:hypothetical protein
MVTRYNNEINLTNGGGYPMKEESFEKFLLAQESITSKEKAVNSRMSKGRRIERDLHLDLEVIVQEDYSTYRTLLMIQEKFGDKNGAIQNVLRKYYFFTHGKEFPTIAACKKRFG